MEHYLDAFKKFADFQGRSTRKQYWMFFLFNILASIVVGIVENTLGLGGFAYGYGLLSGLYSLALFVPSLAYGVRRLHDSSHSGWWLLLPIVNLIFLLSESSVGSNKYGANPNEVAVAPKV